MRRLIRGRRIIRTAIAVLAHPPRATRVWEALWLRVRRHWAHKHPDVSL